MVNVGLYGMRIARLLFDESEAPESVARRIVRAFNPGEVFQVRGKYFKVSSTRGANETIQGNVVGDKYTLVLNVGDPEPILSPPVGLSVVTPKIEVVEQAKPISVPPPSAVVQVLAPLKAPTSESGEYRIEREGAAKVTREGPPKLLPVAGQVWQTKDSRRINSPPFTVLRVDDEFAYTDKGAKISLKRWRNYRLVDLSVEVFQRSSG